MGLSDLFKAKWEHSDPRIRLRAVRELQDKGQLAGMAIMDRDREVGLAVIDRLFELSTRDGDFAIVAQIAGDDQFHRDRRERAAELIRQWNLRSVGQAENDTELAAVALGRFDPEVRLAAVRKITDDAALARVAADANHGEVILEATRKIRSSEVVRSLVRGTSLGEEALLLALRKCGDQALAVECALDRRRPEWVRAAAVDFVTDPSQLERLAMESAAGESARRKVLERMDSTALERVIRTTDSRWIRDAALERINDDEVLVRLAIELEDDGEWHDRFQPTPVLWRLEKLRADAALARVAREARGAYERNAAACHVRNATVAYEIACTNSDSRVARTAAGRVDDPVLLRQLTAIESRPAVALMARERLQQPQFTEIEAKRAADPAIRLDAIQRLWSVELLQELAETEKDGELREAARARLVVARDRSRARKALEAEIESLKRNLEYRQQLSLKVEGDSQVWEYFAKANPDAVIFHVERLEERLRHL